MTHYKTTTMRGVQIDMSQLIARNAQKIALGNAKMNARGDVIGKGGVIVTPREQIAREYHRNNPKAVKQVALKDIKKEIMAFDSPAQAVEAVKAAKKQRKIIDNDE